MMPTPTLLFLVFGVCALAGGLRTIRLRAVARKTDRTDSALHRWSEEPLSSWRYEPYSSVAVLVHTLAIALLAVAALGAVFNPGTFDNPLTADDTTMVVLVWIAEGGSIALVGYLLGSFVAFPLAARGGKLVAIGITEEGMVFGRALLPWGWFSHFSIDRSKGILRLYSAFAPDLPSFVSKPTSSASMIEIDGALRQFLPGEHAPVLRAWYRTKYLLIPAMTVLCLPLVTAGWLASLLPRELALFSIAVLAGILSILGGRVVSLFGFGVFRIERRLWRSPPAT